LDATAYSRLEAVDHLLTIWASTRIDDFAARDFKSRRCLNRRNLHHDREIKNSLTPPTDKMGVLVSCGEFIPLGLARVFQPDQLEIFGHVPDMPIHRRGPQPLYELAPLTEDFIPGERAPGLSQDLINCFALSGHGHG
jgi:hypothetical protein